MPDRIAISPDRNGSRRTTLVLGLLVAVAALIAWSLVMPQLRGLPPRTAGEGRIPIAVLGDSDSHSYRDTWTLPDPSRGGPYRGVALQWTDVLHQLRSGEVDQGRWGVWGDRRRFVLLRRLVGLDARLRTKTDFAFNLSLSGARCADLNTGTGRQLDPLLAYLRREPEAWERGAVVIRIGINDLLRDDQVEDILARGIDPAGEERIGRCIEHIGDSVRGIRGVHAGVAIVVVGLFDETAAPPWIDTARDPSGLRRVRGVVAAFDRGLREIAAAHPRIAFLDQREWWQRHWGEHDWRTGAPRPREVVLRPGASVANTRGDHPRNAVLEDGHAGTVVNAFWTNHLVRTLRVELDVPITPLETAEILGLVDPEANLTWETEQ